MIGALLLTTALAGDCEPTPKPTDDVACLAYRRASVLCDRERYLLSNSNVVTILRREFRRLRPEEAELIVATLCGDGPRAGGFGWPSSTSGPTADGGGAASASGYVHLRVGAGLIGG